MINVKSRYKDEILLTVKYIFLNFSNSKVFINNQLTQKSKQQKILGFAGGLKKCDIFLS